MPLLDEDAYVRPGTPATEIYRRIPLDFKRVPRRITDQVEHLAELIGVDEDNQADLYEYASKAGITLRDLAEMAYHDPAGNIPLRLLYESSRTADLNYEIERQWQYWNARATITWHIARLYPERSTTQRMQLEALVGLGFIRIEHGSIDMGYTSDEGYRAEYGWSREELFAQVDEPEVRDNLRRLDRLFFMLLTALEPEPEALTSLAYERLVRRQNEPDVEAAERAFELVEALLSWSYGEEDEEDVGEDEDETLAGVTDRPEMPVNEPLDAFEAIIAAGYGLGEPPTS